MSLCTEEEAEECRCPHLSIAQQAPMNCVGANCMAWRWDDVESLTEFGKMAEDGVSRAPVGYCGLAGKP